VLGRPQTGSSGAALAVYSAESKEDFEEVVRAALDGLPEDLEKLMSNVQIVVEDLPTRQLAAEIDTDRERLLGLYQGIPLTDRGQSYFGVLPDRIALYRRNLERVARSRNHLTQVVKRTVLHEIAHHFGIDDERLEELGWG
jgi:predicted Zn-dependent protease with MMP-like domain